MFSDRVSLSPVSLRPPEVALIVPALGLLACATIVCLFDDRAYFIHAQRGKIG